MEKLEKLGWGIFDPRYTTVVALFGEGADKRLLMDSDEEIAFFILLCCYWLNLASNRIGRAIDNDSEMSGHQHTQELLHGTSTQCHVLMRLSREAYVLLCNHFRRNNWLQSSKHISVEEKIDMFLTTIAHNKRFRIIKRRFKHSTKTVHRCFHEVLNAMMIFAKEVIVPTNSNATVNSSERHRRLKEIFSGAIGICDFDMIFTFVWAGWEGITHDSRVLKEIAFNPTPGFPFPPPDKYYLCDAAYTNTRGFMAPYSNTRYWLSDYRRRRPLTKEEKFNHVHAQLRNVIKRGYGVLKARFPILKRMTPFPFSVQRDIVVACFAVHNFIKKCDIHDELFMAFEENNNHTQGGENDGQNINDMEWGSQGNEYMDSLHDQIANQLG
ncbi:uncharacterized protein LOC111916555 [Lactuca sativa]|uniref:uncharacterized protein LOC111916555 n=1 Tax=Lactuca sativa TaxID=4236 RepID=UPI000CD9A0FC|nr:uncharacterized protein LOC111916555 [Lactuca sativa]